MLNCYKKEILIGSFWWNCFKDLVMKTRERCERKLVSGGFILRFMWLPLRVGVNIKVS